MDWEGSLYSRLLYFYMMPLFCIVWWGGSLHSSLLHFTRCHCFCRLWTRRGPYKVDCFVWHDATVDCLFYMMPLFLQALDEEGSLFRSSSRLTTPLPTDTPSSYGSLFSQIQENSSDCEGLHDFISRTYRVLYGSSKTQK